MTAKIVFKMDCPACGKHLATKADLLTKEVTEDEITATVQLDHNSWSKAHGDDNCALKDLTQVEDALGDR